jgi:hypothetical protein
MEVLPLGNVVLLTALTIAAWLAQGAAVGLAVHSGLSLADALVRRVARSIEEEPMHD